jgi:hypothetical protein
MTEADREARVGALEEWASVCVRDGKVRLSAGDELSDEGEEEWFLQFRPGAAIALGMRLIDAGLVARGVTVDRLAVVINPEPGTFEDKDKEEEKKPEDLPS